MMSAVSRVARPRQSAAAKGIQRDSINDHRSTTRRIFVITSFTWK
jgi:hypothetical protein